MQKRLLGFRQVPEPAWLCVPAQAGKPDSHVVQDWAGYSQAVRVACPRPAPPEERELRDWCLTPGRPPAPSAAVEPSAGDPVPTVSAQQACELGPRTLRH